MDDRRSIARSFGLLVISFVATLALLGGLALVVVGRGQPSPAAVGPTAGSPTASVPLSASPPASGGSPLAPSPTGDPVLVGAGDIASCGLDGDQATAALLDGIAGTVFTAGDNAYDDGSAMDYANCYEPSWGRHKARTRPAPGNHEYQTQNAQGYRDYFGSAAVSGDGETWYSYDLGAWHVIVLDSNCSPVGGCDDGSPQGRWLAADLAASGTVCTLAIWHHPRFSSGDEHGSDDRTDPFWRQLYAEGADVVVNGHDHDYERFTPQDPEGRANPERGIRQFVVGTGGAALRGFRDPLSTSELRAAVTHGVMKLTLRSQSYDWEWLPTSGLVSDRGSEQCR